MSLLAIKSGKKRATDFDYERREPLPLGHIFVLALITIAAFAIRYWFNFISPHINAYGSCDASEYLANAGALFSVSKLPVSFWRDAFACLFGSAPPDAVARLKMELAPLSDFRISGPVFPLFLASSYLIGLSPYSLQNWAPPVFAQCLISAATCLFIGMTASRAFGKATGYIAAALAAVYPAFIINSGRLYSETFSAFLLSILCYITVLNFTRRADVGPFCRSTLVAGTVAACLQFTRSIMVVLTVALIPISLFQQGWRKGIAAVACFAVGFALIALPWLGMQKLTFGTSSLVVDRVGHYNFFIGNNTPTLGWLSIPYPDGSGIEAKSLPQLASEAYEKSPSHWWSLMLDKPLRLFLFPWNDFRTAIKAVDFQQQVWWHQIMLLLAAVGLVLSFAAPSGRVDDDYERSRGSSSAGMMSARVFLLCVFLLHSIYLFFITVPRYNLTAMPIVMIFAAAGVSLLGRLTRAHQGVAAASSVLVSVAFTFIIVRLPFVNLAATLLGSDHASVGLVLGRVFALLSLIALCSSLWIAVNSFTYREFGGRTGGGVLARVCLILLALPLVPLFALPANASGRWFEWSAPLRDDGQTITQTLMLPREFQERLPNRQIYLLVDADSAGSLSSVSATVNGAKLDEPSIPSISLVGEFDRYQPTRYGKMREIEWVFNSLTEAAGIANADLRQWFIYPIPNELLAGKPGIKVQLTHAGTAPCTVYGGYATSATGVHIPTVDLYSWEKAFYGVENDHGFSDCRYTTRVNSLAATSYDMDLSNEPGVQSGRYNIHLLSGPPVAANTTRFTVEPSQPVVKSMDLLRAPISIPVTLDSDHVRTVNLTTLPAYSPTDLWIVRISGEVRRNAGTAKLNLLPRAIATASKGAYAAPWCGTTEYTTDWRRFDCAVPMQPGDLPEHPDKLSFEFSINNPRIANAAQVQGISEFRNVNVQIVRLPNNPLHSGYIVY